MFVCVGRFVNGMNDTVHSYGRGKGSIKNTVQQVRDIATHTLSGI